MEVRKKFEDFNSSILVEERCKKPLNPDRPGSRESREAAPGKIEIYYRCLSFSVFSTRPLSSALLRRLAVGFPTFYLLHHRRTDGCARHTLVGRSVSLFLLLFPSTFAEGTAEKDSRENQGAKSVRKGAEVGTEDRGKKAEDGGKDAEAQGKRSRQRPQTLGTQTGPCASANANVSSACVKY